MRIEQILELIADADLADKRAEELAHDPERRHDAAFAAFVRTEKIRAAKEALAAFEAERAAKEEQNENLRGIAKGSTGRLCGVTGGMGKAASS